LIYFLFTLLFFLVFDDDENYHPTTFVFPAYKHTYGIRRAGPTELFLLVGFRVKFRSPQGLACVRLDAWEDPDDPHDDDELTVYGVNSGQNNIIFNRSMWKLGVYGIDEEDEQLLNRPNGICANSKGDVYVADTGNYRIVRLFNPEHNLEYVSSIGYKGNQSGQFDSPRDVALDNYGNLFVSDSGNHRIQVFDSTDTFLFEFSNNGYLIGPNGIAVTDILEKNSHIKESFLIVIDSLNSRINKFDLAGNLQNSVSMRDLGFNEVKLEYACIDFHNHILITDSKNHCIHKFNHNLKFIVSFGKEGNDDHEFEKPTGITIHRRFGQLFVAEESGAQYYWVGTDILDFQSSQFKDNVIFTLSITEPSNLTADILDNQGKFVMRLYYKRRLSNAGKHILQWNGFVRKTSKKIMDEEEIEFSNQVSIGQIITPGTYRIKLNLEATYSSRTHFVRTAEYEFNFMQ
jgi:hypothetical protein